MKPSKVRKAPKVKSPPKNKPFAFVKENMDGKPSKSPQTPMKKKTLSNQPHIEQYSMSDRNVSNKRAL